MLAESNRQNGGKFHDHLMKRELVAGICRMNKHFN